MDFREVFYGGYVDCYQFFWKSFEGWILVVRFVCRDFLKKYYVKYKDFILLYFFINKNGIYFVGYFVVFCNCEFEKIMFWSYFGLMYCKVLVL